MMERPDPIFVTGCNAAGKSSLIRAHLSLFPDYEIIMTDVYKERSREVFKEAMSLTLYIQARKAEIINNKVSTGQLD